MHRGEVPRQRSPQLLHVHGLHTRHHLDGVAQTALQHLDGLIGLRQKEEPVGPLLIEALAVRSHFGNLEQFARVLVVAVDHQTDPPAILKCRGFFRRQAAQEFQWLADIAGFGLPAGGHQEDRFGDAVSFVGGSGWAGVADGRKRPDADIPRLGGAEAGFRAERPYNVAADRKLLSQKGP